MQAHVHVLLNVPELVVYHLVSLIVPELLVTLDKASPSATITQQTRQLMSDT